MAYSKWADDDSTTVLTGSDSTRLWSIGALCPYIYGPAVYTARTMLFSIDSTYFSLGNDCEVPYYAVSSGKRDGSDEDEPEQSEENPKVFVYPNPSNGQVTVRFNGDVPEGCLFELTGIDGRSVRVVSVNKTESTFNLQIAAGLYIYKVRTEHMIIENGKLVITDN